MKKLFKLNVKYFLHTIDQSIIWLKHFSLIIILFVATIWGLYLNFQEVFMGIHRFPVWLNRINSFGAIAIYLGFLALLFLSVYSFINYRGWKRIKF